LVPKEEIMSDDGRRTESAPRVRVTVSVEPQQVTRLNVGTCWRVVDSSLGSLWEEHYTVTLEEIEGVSDADSQPGDPP
jgi:hypothetical protein